MTFAGSRLLTHGGGIVFRRTPDGLEYLLVRSRKTPGAWVFPKGHIERGESVQQTARREVAEEAGVHGRIICSAGHLSFGSENTEMFLMAFESFTETPPERECVWLIFEEAVSRLAFLNSRELLRFADPVARSTHK